MTYGVKEVRTSFRVSEGTVLAWIRSKELAAINVAPTRGGRPKWRMSEEALKQFELLRGTVAPTSAPTARRRKPQAKDACGPY